MPATTFDTPLRSVVRGSKRLDIVGAIAKRLDIVTVGDLMRHYPRRYVSRGELTDISALRTDDEVTIIAEVASVTERPMRNKPKRKMYRVVVGDGRTTVALVFFNQRFTPGGLKPGRRGLFAGKVSRFKEELQLAHPAMELFDVAEDDASDTHLEEFVHGLLPIYPTTQGVQSWELDKMIKVLLATVDFPPDPLPYADRQSQRVIPLAQAFRDIHHPRDHAAAAAARRRLAFDEALALQAVLAVRRHESASAPGTPRPGRPAGVLDAFDARLPFALTRSQQRVGEIVAAELALSVPMSRLLQGEVGSGKTVVAIRAMLQVVDSGGQAALLAPTEVLAVQHARSLEQLLGPLAHADELGGAEVATRVVLLTGSMSASAKRRAHADIAAARGGIVVGTHALIQEAVSFGDLGLVVVDEQHRFGVEQRDALRSKADRAPHLLVMTATPIPRTVAITVFGDLDISEIRELPGGRSPISTTVVPVATKPAWLPRAWERVREEVAKGFQTYVVCPRITAAGGGTAEEVSGAAEYADDGEDDAAFADEYDDGTDADREASGSTSGSDALTDVSDGGSHASSEAYGGALDGRPAAGLSPSRSPGAAAEETAATLATGPLAGLRVGLLHGRLPAEEKEATMAAFASGELDVLVATTVIEVGVDVARASTMVVLDADRFGISALHQLRGRVGRGSAPGLCLLVTEADPGSPAYARVEAVASTTDGFELAQVDLQTRREGDILGAAQSGRRNQLRLLSLRRDGALIGAARTQAGSIVTLDPTLRGVPYLRDQVNTLTADQRADYLQRA